jgi:hypothetical protein
MKFYGNVNETVSRQIKLNGIRKLKYLFKFDDKGEYETEDIKLIEKLKLHFKYEIENMKHCKKCDFKCTNQGELLSHYRKEHPKED